MDNLASMRPVLCPSILLSQRLSVSENGFVFDPVTGKSSTANRTGVAIIHQLRSQESIQQVVSALQAKFNSTPALLERDVVEFTDLLQQHFL